MSSNDINERQRQALGCESLITRRDFVGATLVTAAMTAAPRAFPQGLSDEWTGYGGVGDYALANGNTAAVVNAAHRIRDGAHVDASHAAANTAETYDLVVVGGGVAGLTAAYTLHKQYGGARRCLVLENHAMFGGESRGNLIELDGYTLAAPQGANLTGNHTSGDLGKIHRELGLPWEYQFASAEGASPGLRISDDHYDAMLKRRGVASIGYYLGRDHGWLGGELEKNIDRLPWAADEKRGLLAWFNDKQRRAPDGVAGTTADPSKLRISDEPTEDTPIGRWLDTMSYGEFIRNQMKLSSGGIARYLDSYLAATLGGSVDCISAYGARVMDLPGVSAAEWRWPAPGPTHDPYFSFPMGNAIYPRYLVRAMLPKAYTDGSLATMVYGRTHLEELDRSENATRIRLGSTVVQVAHEGDPRQAEAVSVIYERGGKLQRVKARAAVIACGGWISRRIVSDMPQDLLSAFGSFHYAPVLTANIAVKHWRFLDKLGISAARWFEGFGFATNVRRPMKIDGKAEPLSPDKPTILTFYVPFMRSGKPVALQAIEGRQRLFGASFVDFEAQIRRQMQEMFGAHGFDSKRDIGAIVLNRWGHAFVVPEPGFYFGAAAGPAARDVVRRGYGRIAFGCSEYQGFQTWHGAMQEGQRAALQVI
jgi:spermidine dehydrogenase